MVDTTMISNALQRVELGEYEKRLQSELLKKHAAPDDDEDEHDQALAIDAMSVASS